MNNNEQLNNQNINTDIPQATPKQEFEKDYLNQLEILTFENNKEALGTIAWIAHFDERFKDQPFSLVMNDIYGSVIHNQYVIAGQPMGDKENLFPVAFITWGMFNTPVATIRANNIRPLSPLEYKSGNIGFFTMFSSPYEEPDKMIELMRAKSSKLQSLSSISFVDRLFKPDYTFRSRQS